MICKVTQLLHFKKSIIFGCIVSVGALFSISSARAADLPSCVSSGNLYNESVAAPVGTYDVFVRLGKAGQRANVTLTSGINGDSLSCAAVGTVEASGDMWLPLGSWRSNDVSGNSVLAVASNSFNGSKDANKPVILLVSKDTPICLPQVECEVDVLGGSGYIRPGSTSPGGSLLQVLVANDPAKDTVVQTSYYVDNQLAYTSPSLASFDMRYVSNNKQALLRVVSYQTGQRIFIPSNPPADFSDTLSAYIFRFARVNKTALVFLTALAATMAVLTVVLLIIRLIHRHQRYRFDHGLAKEPKLSAADQQAEVKRSEIVKRLERMVGITALFLVIAAGAWGFNSFVVQAATVDGRSMERSYQNGDHVFVNKLGKTWTRIAAREYVPKRGDVVVAKAVFGVTDLHAEQPNASYIVKRVIGLPGERVVVQNGTMTVFNNKNPEGFDPGQGTDWQKHIIAGDKTEYIDLTLGPSELFISGDNRPGSIDSRYNGAISTKNIIGKVFGKF